MYIRSCERSVKLLKRQKVRYIQYAFAMKNLKICRFYSTTTHNDSTMTSQCYTKQYRCRHNIDLNNYTFQHSMLFQSIESRTQSSKKWDIIRARLNFASKLDMCKRSMLICLSIFNIKMIMIVIE